MKSGIYTIVIKKMAKNSVLIKFGLSVKRRRQELGLTQEELAERANLHRTYIGMIERAEKNVTLENIAKLAKSLDTSIKKLCSDL